MNFIKENWLKLGGLLSILLIATGISYYYVVALPQQQKAKLLFEQTKYNNERTDKEKEQANKDIDATAQRILLDSCLDDSNTIYWDYIKVNGTLTDEENGTYFATKYHWDEAAKQKKAKQDECFKRYKL